MAGQRRARFPKRTEPGRPVTLVRLPGSAEEADQEVDRRFDPHPQGFRRSQPLARKEPQSDR